jgi:hypothetical protein
VLDARFAREHSPPRARDYSSAFIAGIDGMTGKDLAAELERGGRFVIFQYCISLLVVTILQPSKIYFLRAGESAGRYSGGFTLMSLLLGWWGFPWGPIRTIQALATNAGGGIDVTEDVLASLGVVGGGRQESHEPPRTRARRRRKRPGGGDYGGAE